MAFSVLLLVVTCLWSAVGAFGDASDCLGECSVKQQEETTLLEDRALHTGDDERKARIALTFQGGGLLAFSKYAALTGGLLRAMGKRGSVQSLFKKFDTIVSVSGGTWYATELVYSERFLNLQKELAQVRLAETGELMLENWFYSIDAALNRSSEIKELFPSSATTMRGLASGTSAGAVLNDVAKMESSHGASSCHAPCIAGDVPWSLVNAVILLSTAELPPTVTLGDPVNSWAKSKWWLPTLSVATPANHGDVQVTFFSDKLNVFSYQVKSEMHADIPLYTPAKFSICLGDCAHKQAPVPFCTTADCFGYQQEYHVGRQLEPPFAQSPPLGEGYASTFSNVNQLGLLGVATASSAFLGPVVLQRPEACKTSTTQLLQSAWFTSGPDSFLEATAP
mmetsp:Transcript_14810/g.37269  ORF Transcript_14810/g.37269 Transcript_14810/m.37269 type:complete len:395 (+) Transcript_14810:53-1237(+)